MCQRAVCDKCGKATYEGCGMHVEQVLADVPKLQRCTCRPAQDAPRRGFWAALRRR
ncbi:hypothetical protein CS0771_54050 [Catellatospora sp. IY07-71]|uniref:hypothetical protein n=1 Tax=Catellatospora sp. IY07-71 TaxID=2728827 RepID=UPI001BB30639|nr:hypothetical protein [Catellatospora sp. IY07-71]BCJ75861.1 hypothetical protein CS0771_54050 [Catellatospora sp. IY07-71]